MLADPSGYVEDESSVPGLPSTSEQERSGSRMFTLPDSRNFLRLDLEKASGDDFDFVQLTATDFFFDFP